MSLSKKLNCIIVDDEPKARNVLRRYIDKDLSLQLNAEFSSATPVIDYLENNQVDVIFLDMEMPKISGMDLAKRVNKNVKVVITTAHPEYAVQGFDLEVFDYLLKPVRIERFSKTINRILQLPVSNNNAGEKNQKGEPPYLFFRTERKMVKVYISDILYVESMRNYVQIVTTDKVISTKNSITSIEVMLPAESFLRIHRSFIVAKSKLTSYSSEVVEIYEIRIPIGKFYRDDVLELLGK
jgi:DNA-binding LytR/AlgR family response regulator